MRAVRNRFRVIAGLLATLLAGGTLLAVGAAPASAVTTFGGSAIYIDQTFYAYVGAGETLDVSFTQTAAGSQPVTITVSSPTAAGAPCVVPASAANGVKCAVTDLSSATPGVWKIDFDAASTNQRYSYDIVVRDAADAVVTGRIWTGLYNQYQSGTSAAQNLWIATREGYLYGMQLINFNGIGSSFRANGFGLVEDGTCTPIYRSAAGTSINANGIPLEAGVDYSSECGDDYWLFFEEPDAALPAAAPSIDGELWVRPAVVPASAEDLAFTTSSPTTRAGEITFDLAGINGGYTIQIDVNADGDYDDAVDRIIPWGSPPGEVVVPFDGLDGLGAPIGICQPINAQVVVDRAGEMHFVLEDVEQLGNNAQTAGGIRLTGLTDGVIAPDPLLYWDDTNFPPSGLTPPEPWPSADGTAGVDSLAHPTNGVHGWRNSWGDVRSIENWTYYEASAGAEVAIEAPCAPSLTLDKIATLDDTNGNDRADVGETIAYTFEVANTGNTPIDDVAVTDPRVTGLTPASVDLPVGGVQTFTAAPYVVTQADVDAGGIPNTAVASGSDPLGETVESNTDSEFVPTPDRAPALTIDKQAVLNDEVTDNDLADLGETITYSFLVENTGNTTLADVTVVDPRVTGISPAPVDLAPGESQLFTAAPYLVTQDDLNTGVVANSATATGTSPTGEVESPPDDTDIPTPLPDPYLELEKDGVLQIDADSDGVVSAGDTVRYTFTVSNTGTVDVDDVTIDDPRLTGPTTPASADIAAGTEADFTADYVVTQADIDAGVLRNTATAAGLFGGDTITSNPDTVELPTEPRAPALEITKTGDLDDTDGDGFADAGETITYGFEVENTGNTTLDNVVVLDARLTGIETPAGPLAPGDIVTLSSDPYTVTQADVDAGGVTNVAVARGNVPGGPETTSPPDEEFIDGPPPAGAIELEKIATLDDANGNGYADAGEQIVYSFTIANVGNVTLTNVTVQDDRIADLLPEPLAQLAPGVVATVVADAYTVLPSQATGDPLVNVATATGVLPDGTTVIESDEDDATLPTLAIGMANTGATPGAAALGAALVLLLGLGALAVARLRRARPRHAA